MQNTDKRTIKQLYYEIAQLKEKIDILAMQIYEEQQARFKDIKALYKIFNNSENRDQ